MKTSSTQSPNRFIFSLGLLIALFWASPALTSPDKRAEAETLTQSLVGLNTDYQRAAPGAESKALQKLIEATIERQAQLAELINTDPGAVLRVAMPERIRNQMPREVQSFIEQRLDLKGELEVMYEDYEDGSHRLHYTLKARGKRITLHFDSLPSGLISGAPAQVSGVLLDDAMAVETGKDDVLMLSLGGGEDGGTNGATAAPLANTFGAQRTLVMLVNFSTDTSEPWTVTEAEEVVFGSVSDYFWENSYNQTWLAGDVFGWFTIPLDPAGCPTSMIAYLADQAAEAAGADLSAYDRFVYAFPDIGCSWGGKASVGGVKTTAYFDGTLMNANTVGHELGHNFGLYHSHDLLCGDVVVSDSGCTSAEYGDLLDRMGGSAGHFNSFQKERLGWVDYGISPPVVTVNQSGSYQLEPVSIGGNGVKGVRVLRSVDPATGQRTWYYLETRQAIGFDDWLTGSRYEESVLNGLVFRLGTEDDPDSSFLLDMTPDSTQYDLDDLALPTGASYTDEAAGVTISAGEISAAGAIVNVSFGPQSCVRADPSVNLTPTASEWVVPGTPVQYTASVTNNDSDACTGAIFDLTAQVPDGWVTVFDSSSNFLAPGASLSSEVMVTSSMDAGDGVYDIVVTAAHGIEPGSVGLDTATYTVMAQAGGVNEPPVAVDDNVLLQQVEPVVIDVLANDWDSDDDSIQVTSVTQGVKGSVVNHGDGTLTYTPGSRFKNKDSFSYEISDGTDTATAIVSISVQESSKGGGNGRGKPKG